MKKIFVFVLFVLCIGLTCSCGKKQNLQQDEKQQEVEVTDAQKTPETDNSDKAVKNDIEALKDAQKDLDAVLRDAQKDLDAALDDVKKELDSALVAGIQQAQAVDVFEYDDGSGWNMKIQIIDCPEDVDKAKTQMGISSLLKSWNELRNQKDAEKLAALYTDKAFIRGDEVEQKNIAAKLDKSFKKHPDFSQKPGSEVLVNYLDKETWSVRFPESFTQDGKTTDTEIFIVLTEALGNDGKIEFRIHIESDISTDKNIQKKIGYEYYQKPDSCHALLYNIMLESPEMRYNTNLLYVPAMRDMKSGDLINVTLNDENSESNEPYGEYAIVEKHADHEVTVSRYSIDAQEYVIKDEIESRQFTIDEKYRADLRRLCKIK